MNRGENIKYLPYVFTEQGVAMLATVIKTQVASSISIDIMKTFVIMRHFVNDNAYFIKKTIEIEENIQENLKVSNEHENKINEIFSRFDKEVLSQKLFYEGQIYDAYSLLINIIRESKDKIIIIDNNILYHAGASLKDLGKKCFAITKMNKSYIKDILQK